VYLAKHPVYSACSYQEFCKTNTTSLIAGSYPSTHQGFTSELPRDMLS
jgi:hypothetical protein